MKRLGGSWPGGACWIVLLPLAVSGAGTARAAGRGKETGKRGKKQPPPMPAPVEVERAITRGLDFLETRQQPEGFWQNNARTKRVETTLWTLWAFLANGHTPHSGPYRQSVAKGLNWLVKQVAQPRFIWRDKRRIAPIVPAQVLLTYLWVAGMGTNKTDSEDLIVLCERGVRQVLALQFQRQGGMSLDDKFLAGGWGRVEISYWFTLCLLAARQTGIRVSQLALEEARAFWKRHYQPQHGSFYDQVSRGNPGFNYHVLYTARALIALVLLGSGPSREVRGGLGVLRKCDVGNPDWFWQRVGYRRSGGAPVVNGNWRRAMGGHARILGEWYLALKLGGAGRKERARDRALYSGRILARQNEDGSFRHPGRNYIKWPASHPYASEAWCRESDGFGLGYGVGWSEVMITARAVFALGLPKMYLPVFTFWTASR